MSSAIVLMSLFHREQVHAWCLSHRCLCLTPDINCNFNSNSVSKAKHEYQLTFNSYGNIGVNIVEIEKVV